MKKLLAWICVGMASLSLGGCKVRNQAQVSGFNASPWETRTRTYVSSISDSHYFLGCAYVARQPKDDGGFSLAIFMAKSGVVERRSPVSDSSAISQAAMDAFKSECDDQYGTTPSFPRDDFYQGNLDLTNSVIKVGDVAVGRLNHKTNPDMGLKEYGPVESLCSGDYANACDIESDGSITMKN